MKTGSPVMIGFYGPSNSGKTTLVTHLTNRFVNEGYKVAVIKKSDKKSTHDMTDKDTWKFTQAGASLVVFSSGCETSLIFNSSMTLNDIKRCIPDVDAYDLLFIEGADDPVVPKIIVGAAQQRENTIAVFDGDIPRIEALIKSMIK
jgi:molybdopterin-guanine dinucleotide biosynthesis protein MobB